MSADSVLPVVYDPFRKKWVFTRRYGQGEILRPTGILKTYYSPQENISVLGKGRSALHEGRAMLWNRYLMNDIPELASVVELLPDLIEESQIITACTEVYDPTVGKLMDVGSASILQDVASDNQTGTAMEAGMRTLTYVTGAVGSKIGVAKVVDSCYAIEEDEDEEGGGNQQEETGKGVGLVAPGLRLQQGPGAGVVYKCTGMVKQICTAKSYSNNGERYRLNSALVALRSSDSSIVFEQSYDLDNQQPFALTPLLELPISQTGKTLHSNLTFCPYSPNYLGIVDESGTWSVCDLQAAGRSKRAIASGTELAGVPQGYAWGKIQWGKDENSLLVANRAQVAIFDIREKPPGISYMTVNNSAQNDWVLDLCSVPSNRNNTLVLTSSSLVLVDARKLGERLLSQDHYRHTDDISLQMEVFSLKNTWGGWGDGDVTTALIYSRMNPLISACQLGYKSGFPVWLDNPYLWEVEKNLRPNTVLVLPTRLGGGAEGLGAVRKVSAAVTCLSLGTDLVVRSQLYTSAFTGAGSILTSIRTRSTESTDDSRSGGFATKMTGGDQEWNRGYEYEYDGQRLMTADLSELYKYAFSDDDESFKTSTDLQFIEGYREKLQGRIYETFVGEKETKGKGIVTFFELQKPRMLFDDLEALTVELEKVKFGDDVDQGADKDITLLVPKFEGFPFYNDGALWRDGAERGEDGNVQAIYQRLFGGWVAPLPSCVPNKVRLRKERLCRMIATEIWLANHGVLLPNFSEINLISKHTLHENGDVSSTQTPPSPPPPPIQLHPPQDFITRLRKYTPVSNVVPVSEAPSSMPRIVDQWVVGEDPNDFEYNAEGQPTTRKSKIYHSRHGKPPAPLPAEGFHGAVGASLPVHLYGGTAPMLSMSQPVMLSSERIQVKAEREVEGNMEGSEREVDGNEKGKGKAKEKEKTKDNGIGVMSQVERGKFGGRPGSRLVKPVKKKRRLGF